MVSSPRILLAAKAADDPLVVKTLCLLRDFYKTNTQIKESHGLTHVLAVYRHAVHAIDSFEDSRFTHPDAVEILLAALLHDVDDRKYFPDQAADDCLNAKNILNNANVPDQAIARVHSMVQMVSCSKNGNSVPEEIRESNRYYKLIPRWSDRLEAVGRQGVVRCYQYAKEKNNPLSSNASPKATTLAEMWEFASPSRFDQYQSSGGNSADMISHYYDKLLHVARPPKEIVQNRYLEEQAEASVAPLIEVCLRFGQTGTVDEKYLQALASE